MTYTHTTLGQAKTQLIDRLRDSGKVFWTDGASYSELDGLIAESLRTWQLLAGYWRDREVLNTVSGTAFYDLRTELSSTLGFTIHVRDSIAVMEHRLLEPTTPDTWSGSSMFTLTDLVTALQNRRNQFLKETGCVVTRITKVATLTPRQQLADTVMDVLRAAWINADGDYAALFRDTEWGANVYDPEWTTTPGTPERYSIISSPPVSLATIPMPNDVGRLELIIVQAPAALNTVSNNLMYIPDDMVSVVQWGAIADLLLREGEARDPVRGEYAQKMYELGSKLAASCRVAVNFEIQGNAANSLSVFDADTYDPDWQNSSDEPGEVLLIGQNLVAPNPVPDGIYSITFDVFRNAPIPVNDTDYIQAGREDLDVILGYAEHLASFKQGGVEFLATVPLAQSFLKQAARYASRLTDISNTILDFMQSLPDVSPQSVPLAAAKEEGNG